MDGIINVVKEHPIPIVIGVVILLLIISSASSKSSATPSNGAALAQSQLTAQSNSQIAGINADVNKTAMVQATTRTGIMANLFGVIAGINAEKAAADSTTSFKTIQAGLASLDNRQMMESNLALGRDKIFADITTHASELDAQITMGNNDNNAKLKALGVATQGNLDQILAKGNFDSIISHDNNLTSIELMKQTGINASGLATVNGAVASGLLGQSLDFQGANMPTILQHSENMARITGNNAATLATIQTGPATINAQSNAHAQNVKNDQSWLSSIGNVVSSLFSWF